MISVVDLDDSHKQAKNDIHDWNLSAMSQWEYPQSDQSNGSMIYWESLFCPVSNEEDWNLLGASMNEQTCSLAE